MEKLSTIFFYFLPFTFVRSIKSNLVLSRQLSESHSELLINI